MWFQRALWNNEIMKQLIVLRGFCSIIVWTYTLVTSQRCAGCTYSYYSRRNMSKISFDKSHHIQRINAL